MSILAHVLSIALTFVCFASVAFGQTEPTTISTGSVIERSRGNTFNPDISLNTLFLYRNSNRGNNLSDTKPNGFLLDETELMLAADVDPYLRAVGLLAVRKESSEWKVEPEEAYGETLQLPSVTLRAGKFKAAFGKYNTYHAHALPFIDAQLINTLLLGEEGLNDVGLSASVLIPIPWFSEFTLQALQPQAAPFSGTSPNGTVTVARLRNLWDLTDDLTAELGLSGAQGSNDVNKQTILYGGDLTLKWRPSQGGKYSALIWSTEYINGDKKLDPEGNTRTRGGATFIQWQFAQRWWLQGRTEYTDVLDSTVAVPVIQRKHSALLAFLPTEFSGVRLQYDQLQDAAEIPEKRIVLQLNLSIGAHPAHVY